MKKCVTKIKGFFIKHPKLFFGMFFLLILIIHFSLKLNWGDEVWFKKYSNSNLWVYLLERYETWTSRLIIEASMVTLLKFPFFVWMILDSFMITLIAYCINYLFVNKKSIGKIVLVFMAIFLYSFPEIAVNTGWIATSMNYIWPLALGLVAFIPIKNRYDGKCEKWYYYPVYLVSLLYACNQEQMCLIIFVFYFLFIIDLYRKKKLTVPIIIFEFIALASLLFIVTCPGNNSRNILETAHWYPAYQNFGIFGKLYLGITTTGIISLNILNIPLFFLSILLPFLVYYKRKLGWAFFVSCIPFNIFLVFNILREVIIKIFPGFIYIKDKLFDYSNTISNLNFASYEPFVMILLSILLLGSIFISLYVIIQKKDQILMLLIFLAGVVSRVIMGFSSTIYASGNRTFIFMNFSIIILIVYFLSEESYMSKKTKVLLIVFLIAFAIVQTSNWILGSS